MSEEELQLDEENKEMENLNLDEDLQKKEDSNPENEINIEQELEQNKEQEGEEQAQENLEENNNNEEKEEVKEEVKEENDNEKENENENELEENLEKINLEENNNENGIINNNEQNEEPNDEVENKEITMFDIKKISNGNINHESFGKTGFFEENTNQNSNIKKSFNEYVPKKNTKQLLDEINKDMDSLEKNLSPIFQNYKIKNDIFFHSQYNNNDYKHNYTEDIDQQNYDIKKLIEKANKSINKNNYNHYGLDYYQKNNSIFLNNNERYENGGIYSNYMERENNSSIDNDNGYIRNLSPEKNISKQRIKNFHNFSEYNNAKNYQYKPMIYRQKETYPIKNSYMNEYLGQPQTFQKYEYPNNLVYSSDKISFRKIKYGNINQSLDMLFRDKI